MRERQFDGGVRVSVLGIGCGRVGSVSNPVPPREVEATLEFAVESGVSLFDTADIYGQGDSERTLGRMLRRHSGRMFIVTKVGGRHGRFRQLVRLAKPMLRFVARRQPAIHQTAVAVRTASVVHDFDPADLSRAVDASRRRLQLDQLDALLLHNPSAETLQKPGIQRFLEDALSRGRAKRVGVSVDTPSAVAGAVALPVITMVQAPGRVVDALKGSPVLDQARRRGVGLFIREIIGQQYRDVGDTRSARDALSDAVAPDYVTAAIVGVSTRNHLSTLLPAVA